MTNPKDKAPKVMPKGGRKGGATFPRIPLEQATGYARKLVSKTHTGAQSQDIIYSGVVGAKSGTGNVRISALKQYGYMEGDTTSGYIASDLAKRVNFSGPDELRYLYRQAALKPKVFKGIFDAFAGDKVSRSKLKQRAADLGVHPDECETCVDIYVKSMQLAELISTEGDQFAHVSHADINGDEADNPHASETLEPVHGESSPDTATDVQTDGSSDSLRSFNLEVKPPPRAIFNVNISLDSSLDIEKLARQLELLKKFGAI